MLPDFFLEKIYPIGTIYRSTTNKSPQSFLGGTWTRIQEHELVAYASLISATSIGVSKNISSITKLSTGSFRVNFSKNMANTNYVALVSGEVGGTGQEIVGIYGKNNSNFTYDFTNYNGSAVDPTSVNIAVFGQLASPEYFVWKRTA